LNNKLAGVKVEIKNVSCKFIKINKKEKYNSFDQKISSISKIKNKKAIN
jgi:hypothetical protein